VYICVSELWYFIYACENLLVLKYMHEAGIDISGLSYLEDFGDAIFQDRYLDYADRIFGGIDVREIEGEFIRLIVLGKYSDVARKWNDLPEDLRVKLGVVFAGEGYVPDGSFLSNLCGVDRFSGEGLFRTENDEIIIADYYDDGAPVTANFVRRMVELKRLLDDALRALEGVQE